MQTEIGAKLTEAYEAKKNDLTSFIWKEAKENRNGQTLQKEIRLMDASESDLNRFYAHCKSMLYNEDKVNPGRYVLLNIIKEQIQKCNAELLIRYVENVYMPNDRSRLPRFSYLQSLRTVIDKNKNVLTKDKLKETPISFLTGGIPEEFQNLPVDVVMNACLDTLGSFNKKHLTLNFIVKMGVWFTPQELRELVEKDENGKNRDRLIIVKERLGLNNNISLHVDPKGLSFAELRAMVQLKSKKYSDLTTDQLVILRNKVLFRFENEVERHANQWEERMNQIERVAEARKIDLTC